MPTLTLLPPASPSKQTTGVTPSPSCSNPQVKEITNLLSREAMRWTPEALVTIQEIYRKLPTTRQHLGCDNGLEWSWFVLFFSGQTANGEKVHDRLEDDERCSRLD